MLLTAAGSSALAAPAPTPRLAKLDSRLQALVHAQAAGKRLKRSQRTALVDVYARRDVRVVARRLRRLGMSVAATSARGHFRIVEGRLPVAVARRAAALGRVRAIVSVPAPVLAVGAKTSQGDAAHHGPQARALGPTGAGVDVGIISDSINQVGGKVAGSQSTGDLPATVTVLSDMAGGTDEGRAMAEIAYDEAPGIPRILFGSAFTAGPAAKAQTIDDLVAAGADVIADDTSFFNEPFFQDGVVGQAVDRARAAGVTYFAAAGNQARMSWEGTYQASASPGPGGGTLNDFDPGTADDPIQTVVSVPSGKTLTLFLQWDEPYGQATTDMDIYLTTPAGAPLGTPGTSDNVASGIPFDFATYKNVTVGAVNVAVEIERSQGTRTPFLKYIANNDFGTFNIAEHPTSSDTIAPDAATSAGAITVAAVRYSDASLDDVEGFSSRGPKTILFDSTGTRLSPPQVRVKPDISATDGVSTTVTGFDPFFGTSAAAPSAAGVAALIRSANPSLGPAAIKAIMTDPRATNDCNPIGEPDSACGFGLPFADSGVQMAADTTPPTVTPQLTPPVPDGANGFYTSDVSVGFALSDAESPVFATTGCDPAPVSADTPAATLTCTATSVGGTASGTATVKRDASPPTAPGFNGIAAKTYQRAFVPAAGRVGCTASDPTSGIDSSGCVVSGFSNALGPHTLTATARNGAGLASTSTLTYTVVRTAPAISRLTAARAVSLGALLRRGLRAKVSVARRRTALTASLRMPGRRPVAHMKRTAGAGRATLRLRPTRRGRAFLAGRSRTRLTLVVTGRPAKGLPVTLKRTVVARR